MAGQPQGPSVNPHWDVSFARKLRRGLQSAGTWLVEEVDWHFNRVGNNGFTAHQEARGMATAAVMGMYSVILPSYRRARMLRAALVSASHTTPSRPQHRSPRRVPGRSPVRESIGDAQAGFTNTNAEPRHREIAV